MRLPLLFLLLLPVCLSSFAQTSEVRGRVVDANLKPVEFATVLLQNLNRSTFTDSAGYFFFRLARQYASPEINLKIAVIGKKTIEKTVQVSNAVSV
ncbi:MAG: carboxypeptidase-like regulatory domain-containing protein, partial [Pedobacter sp.]|nr:carboxypeptidase-like regulatory domain-containing protein [Pedobacter sp.]